MSKDRFRINKRSICVMLILISLWALFFVEVDTRQGINYQVIRYRMPLYIKIIEFVDRDYQYRRIVKNIVQKCNNDEEKVLAIFNWCVENIKHQPTELPIVDDHPLNIIIRGYGVRDQFEDIFTILCTYAGFEAFYKEFYDSDKKTYIIAFVKIGEAWYPFSVYYNAYAVIGSRPASISDILRDPIVTTSMAASIPGFDVKSFMAEITQMNFKASSVRVKGQSPIGRLLCVLRGDK